MAAPTTYGGTVTVTAKETETDDGPKHQSVSREEESKKEKDNDQRLYHTKEVTKQVQKPHMTAQVLNTKTEYSKMSQAHPNIIQWLEKQGIIMKPYPFLEFDWGGKYSTDGDVSWKTFLENYAKQGYREWQDRCKRDDRYHRVFTQRIFMPYATAYEHRHVPSSDALVGRLIENLRAYMLENPEISAEALPTGLDQSTLEEKYTASGLNGIFELATLTMKGDAFMDDVMDDLFLPYFKVVNWSYGPDGKPCPIKGYLHLFEYPSSWTSYYRDQYQQNDQREMDRITYDDLDITY